LHYASRTFESWCRTPYQYGRYDVVIQREKGEATLDRAAREFHYRHALNRAFIVALAGRPHLVHASVGALRGVIWLGDRLGAYRTCQNALSAIFGLLYWQGICDELGGRRFLRRVIATARRAQDSATLAAAGRI
jgi:hypothetical protein